MKALARAQDLAAAALGALPPSPHEGAVHEAILAALADLAAIRREGRGADATRAARAGGRLLAAALLAQRDAGPAPSRAAPRGSCSTRARRSSTSRRPRGPSRPAARR
jgi:hypothetical protein